MIIRWHLSENPNGIYRFTYPKTESGLEFTFEVNEFIGKLFFVNMINPIIKVLQIPLELISKLWKMKCVLSIRLQISKRAQYETWNTPN